MIFSAHTNDGTQDQSAVANAALFLVGGGLGAGATAMDGGSAGVAGAFTCLARDAPAQEATTRPLMKYSG